MIQKPWTTGGPSDPVSMFPGAARHAQLDHAMPKPQSGWGKYALMLFIFVVAARPQEVMHGLIAMHPALVTGAFAGLAWLLASGSFTDKLLLTEKSVRYVLGLFAAAVLTIPISVWPGGSFYFVAENYWKVILLFILVFYWCRTLKDVRQLMWVSCFGHFLLAAGVIFTGGVDITKGPSIYSYDRNDLALVFVLSIPMAVMLFGTTHWFLKPMLGLMIATFLYGIVQTTSRGGFIGLIAVGLLLLWKTKQRRWTKAFVVLIAALIFFSLADRAYWERIETVWAPKTEYDRTAGGRTIVWQRALKIFATEPWGVGIAGFETAEGMTHGGKGKWAAPHNSFIQVGVELGVLGLVFFLLLLRESMRNLRSARRLAHKRGGPGSNEAIEIATALEISFWGYIICGFALSQAYSPILYVLAALGNACGRIVKRSVQPETSTMPPNRWRAQRKRPHPGSMPLSNASQGQYGPR